MTEQQPDQPTDAGDTAMQLTDNEQPPEQPETPPSRGDREAARLRDRAQAAEQERDTARQRVESYERREVERILGSLVVDPGAALTLAGDAALDDLRDEDGLIDRERVEALAERLVTERPWLRRQQPADFGAGARRTVQPQQQGASWADAVRGRGSP